MPRITQLFAFISSEQNGDDEGVIAFRGPSGDWMPMVGADAARMESLRPVARVIAEASRKSVRLVRFSVREDLGDP